MKNFKHSLGIVSILVLLIMSSLSYGEEEGISGQIASWSYAAFGENIGKAGIVCDTVEGRREIYLNSTYYWYVLCYNSTTGTYEQCFVSTNLGFSEYTYDRIVGMRVADVSENPGKEIVVVMEHGDIHLYDQATKKYLNKLATEISNYYWVRDFEIADIDRDGQLELLLGYNTHLYAVSTSGALEWSAEVGVRNITVGQMDGAGSHLRQLPGTDKRIRRQ